MSDIIIGIIVIITGLFLRWFLYERSRNSRPNKTFFDDKKRRR